MDYLTAKKFSFVSSALPADTFGVVRYRGSEGLSRCYEFEVMLVSGNLEVDLGDVIQHPVTLTFHREEGKDVQYHGILLGFEQLHSFNQVAFYRAHLVPRLYWLSLTPHNQVFLNKSVPEFIEACLKDGGLSGQDFEFRLQKSYEPLEYVCQYGETHLNFVSRWLEREGLYYFFEQSEGGEKVIFTDSHIAHKSMPQGKSVRYSPPSGMETLHMQEIVSSFTCRYSLTPASVMVKDYNYRKPSLEVSGTAEVDAKGRGQVYSYGDHIRTPEDGNRVAKMYAEAVLCRREVFHGEGSVPYLSPGFTFDLEDHYRKSFNQSYLTLDVDHEGSQTGYLLSGLTLGEEKQEIYYRNSYTAIPASVQFRPERVTPKPQISGCISAKVDAAGSGKYAELDEHGRYKVVLPFDTSGRKDGKASAWFRMASPYAGSDHGMHFPLHKNTEVLLTFMDGDPDRPIIASAVPNPETPSLVKDANQTMAAITTSSGNKIHMEDQEGSERILMHTPKQGSFIRIGAPNDPPAAAGDENKGDTEEGFGIRLFTHKLLDIDAAIKNAITLGESGELVVGGYTHDVFGVAIEARFLGLWEIRWPETWTLENFKTSVHAEEARFRELATTVNIGEENDVINARTTISDLVTRVTNNEADIGNSVLALSTSIMEVRDNEILARNDAIHLVNQNITAVSTKVTALVNGIETVGLQLWDTGTQISTQGTTIEQAGTAILTAGTSIMEVAVGIRNAPVILDN